MKNVALIFAGGTGRRLSSGAIPKQFLLLSGKPVIIHTLEYFQLNERTDSICVVCLKDKIDELRLLAARYDISKISMIVPGGATGQESIFNGLRALYESQHNTRDTLVMIHDGVRPLINQTLINDCIDCARAHGNAITVSPAVETITVNDGEPGQVGQIIERSRCSLAKAPQCYRLGELWDAHERARAEGRHDFIDSACLMRCYGHPLYSVEGSPNNIKITTPTDFYIFRAIVDARENSQIFGI